MSPRLPVVERTFPNNRRRLLVSRKWSGKTLADLRADRKNLLTETLGLPATDPGRYASDPSPPATATTCPPRSACSTSSPTASAGNRHSTRREDALKAFRSTAFRQPGMRRDRRRGWHGDKPSIRNWRTNANPRRAVRVAQHHRTPRQKAGRAGRHPIPQGRPPAPLPRSRGRGMVPSQAQQASTDHSTSAQPSSIPIEAKAKQSNTPEVAYRIRPPIDSLYLKPLPGMQRQ